MAEVTYNLVLRQAGDLWRENGVGHLHGEISIGVEKELRVLGVGGSGKQEMRVAVAPIVVDRDNYSGLGRLRTSLPLRVVCPPRNISGAQT